MIVTDKYYKDESMPMPNLSLEKAIEISGRHFNIQIGEIINRKKKEKKKKEQWYHSEKFDQL